MPYFILLIAGGNAETWECSWTAENCSMFATPVTEKT